MVFGREQEPKMAVSTSSTVASGLASKRSAASQIRRNGEFAFMAAYSAFLTSTAGAGVASGADAGAGAAAEASLPAGGVAGAAGSVVFFNEEWILGVRFGRFCAEP